MLRNSASKLVKKASHEVPKAVQTVLGRESAGQIALIFGINALMTVGKVLMQNTSNQRAGFNPDELRLLKTQEWIRQGVSTTLWLTSTVLSFVIITKMLRNRIPAVQKLSPFMVTMLSTTLSLIPDTFIRPPITAFITKMALKPKSEPSALKNKYSFHGPLSAVSRTSPPAFSARMNIAEPQFNNRASYRPVRLQNQSMLNPYFGVLPRI